MNDQVALAEAHAGLELVGERYRCVASHWYDPKRQHRPRTSDERWSTSG